MKNRINLFKRKSQQDYLSVHAAQFKKYLTFIGVVLFIFFLFLINQTLHLNKTQQDLLRKKEIYLKYLLDKKDTEASVRYFKSKQTQVQTFLKEDAQFLRYYQVLKKSLEEAGEGATLGTFNIDKARKSDFVVTFNTLDEMLSFLSYVERDDFLKNFISLTLNSFNIDHRKVQTNRYQLELGGIFKEVKTQ